MRSLSSLIFILFSAALLAQSPHGDLSIDCSQCHESSTWNIKQNLDFNHDQTNFSLSGQHKTVDCRSCHTTLVFSKAKSDCFSCHKDIHQNSVGFDCQKCHTTDTWVVRNIQQIHRLGRFPLAGAHQRADCIQCHSGFDNLNFQPVGVSCLSCHQNDYNIAQNPNHITAHFSTECQDCHNMTDNSWAAKTFAHEFFPLEGMHKKDNCFACHTQGNFAGLSKDCYPCHQADFVRVKDPNHVAGNFSHDCSQCHNIHNPFSFSTFNHNGTSFPLTGVHSQAQCTSCHQSGYQNTSSDCVSCHLTNFNNANNPNHQTLALSSNCQTCHNTTNPDFKPATFPVHNNYYQLLGAHVTISANCQTCHNGNYNTTPNTCYGCHQQNYNSTTNPPHSSAGFNSECATCHNQNAWTPSTFDHDPFFPVFSGKHKGKWNACSDCHNNTTNFNLFSCIDCHEHNRADMDNDHNGISGYVYASAQCYACHPRGTKEGAFDHSVTNFPLTGSHISTSCVQCHATGYAGTPTTCINCHQEAYNTAPGHVQQTLPTNCQLCHSTTAWNQINFNHQTTQFPLTGAHASVNCSNCHSSGYSGIPTECVSCHIGNYNNAVNPNHVILSLATTCQTCHSTNSDWQPAAFPVHNNYFQLVGAHALIANDCSNCHNGNYTNTPNTCYDCHIQDYQSASPNHVAPGFPHDCTQCHNQSVWKPSTFEHDQLYFPIYSGKHRNDWDACSDCHTNPSNFSEFTCITCHTRQDTDHKHDQVNGYVYESSSCYSCHPRGEQLMIRRVQGNLKD